MNHFTNEQLNQFAKDRGTGKVTDLELHLELLEEQGFTYLDTKEQVINVTTALLESHPNYTVEPFDKYYRISLNS